MTGHVWLFDENWVDDHASRAGLPMVESACGRALRRGGLPAPIVAPDESCGRCAEVRPVDRQSVWP